MMKLLILACVIVSAMAAPQWYRGYGGGYAGYGGYSHGYPADLAPAVVQGGLVGYSNGAVVPRLTPSVAAATAQHLNAKFGAYATHGHGYGLGYYNRRW